MPSPSLRDTLEGLVGHPAVPGNRVDVLHNGYEIFSGVLTAIRAAEHTVDFSCYVFSAGNVGELLVEALEERAAAGVRVRLLIDPLGARTIDRSWVDRLEQAGADVAWYRMPSDWRLWEQNNRNHQRVVLVDESIGLTGGYGIADRWDGDASTPEEWRDVAVRLEGPAVAGLRAAFAATWAATGRALFDDRDRFPAPSSSGAVDVLTWRSTGGPGWNDAATVWATAISKATDRLRIVSPYFAPREDFGDRLVAATERGVDIDILLPGPHADQPVLQLAAQRNFERLLEAGTRIWLYQPTMIHAKLLTVDGGAAVLGTANFDNRSLQRNDEVGVVVFDDEVTAALDERIDADLALSEPVDVERWRDRGLAQRIGERAAGLVDDEL